MGYVILDGIKYINGVAEDTRTYKICSKGFCDRYEMIPKNKTMCKECRNSLRRFF